MNLAPCLAFTLRPDVEGGYVDDPNDPGGATNLGITIGALSDWLGRAATVAEVKALTPARVAPIYGARYWNPVQGDALPAGIDLMVFDHGVNRGPISSARILQQCVRVTADGHIGPMTLAAVRKAYPGDLIARLASAQSADYAALDGFARYGRGWLARVTARRVAALSMAPAHA